MVDPSSPGQGDLLAVESQFVALESPSVAMEGPYGYQVELSRATGVIIWKKKRRTKLFKVIKTRRGRPH